MSKDFHFRLVVVFLVMLAVSFLIAFFAILPSYLFTSEKKSEANAKIEMQKREPGQELNEKTLSSINDLNNKLNLVERAEQNKYAVSQKVVGAIVLKKMSDIKITQILYKNDPLVGKTADIWGVAPSRERLLLFRRALEDDTAFKKVYLPISNFIQGSKIQFYLSLIPS